MVVVSVKTANFFYLKMDKHPPEPPDTGDTNDTNLSSEKSPSESQNRPRARQCNVSILLFNVSTLYK